jgi:hypothetical protein
MEVYMTRHRFSLVNLYAVGLLAAILGMVPGCGENRFMRDWGRRNPRHGSGQGAGGQPDEAVAHATTSATTQAGAEPANLLDSPPESLKASDRRVKRLSAWLDVVRIEVPQGSVSRSAGVWSHLDEQAVDAQRAVTLRRNGLRVGVGRPESWVPIKSILDAIPDRLVYHETPSLNAGVLSLELSAEPDDQTLFFFRDDGTMAGESFPASWNAFQVTYEVTYDDPGKVVMMLKVVPEVRQREGKTEWVRREGHFTRVPVYHGRVLHELAIMTALSEGSFLAIGPGEAIGVDSAVGQVLLTRKADGKRYESIYFLTPQVHRGGPGVAP